MSLVSVLDAASARCAEAPRMDFREQTRFLAEIDGQIVDAQATFRAAVSTPSDAALLAVVAPTRVDRVP